MNNTDVFEPPQGWAAAALRIDAPGIAARRAKRIGRLAGAISHEPANLDLTAAVLKLHRLLARLVGDQVEFATELQPDLPPVRIDPRQLEDVLVGLALDAREAIRGKGLITLRTRHSPACQDLTCEAGSRVELSVVSSVSVPAAAAAHGEPAGPLAADRGRTWLTAVRHVIDDMDGDVVMNSGDDTAGLVSIVFPIARSPIASAGPSGELDHDRRQVVVMLAEDDLHVRRLNLQLLRTDGYRVLEAACGEDAVALSRRHPGPIDLLVTDVVMPGIDGPRTFELLREHRPALRVLYCSGYSQENLIAGRGLDSSEAVLQKPYSRALLLDRVKEAIGSDLAARGGRTVFAVR